VVLHRVLCSCVLCSCVMCSFALAVGSAPPASAAPPGATDWVRPVDGPVARAFAPPARRYGPGHLGVDFAVAPGTTVRAAGPGVVTIAGDVAGALHVVVAHAGGLRTSYSFLATVTVHRGEHVFAGDVLGTTGGSGPNHAPGVVHFGLRAGDEYIDPMLLFGAVDLTRVVHLAPTDQPFGYTVAQERHGLLDGLLDGLGDGASAVGRAVGGAAGGAGSVVAGASAPAADFAADQLAQALGANPGIAIGRGLLEYLDERRHCDASASAADGSGGSGHHVMVVAGIDSATKADGSTVSLAVDELGYRADEVAYFSYGPEGGSYTKDATYAPLIESAWRLGEQLREAQRRDPGREVDLLAHSQGGVVTLAFLKLFYRADDPSFPPLGTVVTFSSPLEGAPAATLAGDFRDQAIGRAALELFHERVHGLPDLNSAAVRDLAADSDFMKKLDATPLPEGVDLTTIGSVFDTTVPGDHATSDDAAQHTIVETGFLFDSHTNVVKDPDALRAARAALEAQPLPCRSFGAFVESALVPRAISLVESGGSTR
jgi:hypothetical protein